MRKEWVFYYDLADLSVAIVDKINFHTARLFYWEDEYGKAESEFKASGINLSGEPTAYTHSNSGYGAMQVTIDPKMQKRVLDAESKVKEHRDKLAEFETWKRSLDHTDDLELELTIEDVNYFGL